MIIDPIPFRLYIETASMAAIPADEQKNLYYGYRYEMVRQFREQYPANCRMEYNYTLGFDDEMAEWCDSRTSEWTLLRNYGYDWPLGFADPAILFEFKIRWL